MAHREARPHTRARLSDAAPAASDKHRLLHRKSRRAVPGPDRGSIPIGSRLRDFASAAMAHREARPHTGARLSDAAPAASDKHRLLIGCGEWLSRVRIVAGSLSEVVFATSHPQPWRIGKPARIPGRAYRTPRQRLRISTASFIGSREGLSRVRIVARSLSEVVFATSHPQPCRIGKPARIPGRAYRTPRQRLRISTASFIGSREGLSRVRIVARSLSEVVFATSDKSAYVK